MHQNSFREHMIEDFQHAPDPLKTAACEIALYCLGELIQRFLQLTPEKMPQPKVMATHRASVPRRTSLSRRASPFPRSLVTDFVVTGFRSRIGCPSAYDRMT